MYAPEGVQRIDRRFSMRWSAIGPIVDSTSPVTMPPFVMGSSLRRGARNRIVTVA